MFYINTKLKDEYKPIVQELAKQMGKEQELDDDMKYTEVMRRLIKAEAKRRNIKADI